MQVHGKKSSYLVSRVLSLSKTQVSLGNGWRAVRRRVLVPTAKYMLPRVAAFYRAGLHRVIFIGVTGSCGKTTTKELIAAVLSSRFKGRWNHGTLNVPHNLATTILRVRPWDRFCILEAAAAEHGMLESSLRMMRPQIGVVTHIGTDHISAFRTLEAIAAEKGKLIAVLPPHGTAILNVDDAHVRAMAARCAGRVITYGLTPGATVRAENIHCRWPERLSFTVRYEEQSYAVHTQFCGAHWVSCILAALAVGLTMGVPLATAVQAVQTVPPFWGRMSVVSHPDGITFIQDDAKAPLWSIPPALTFMKEARARRKIVVIGTISDYTGNSDRTYISVARQALDVADHVIFVGARASKCLKAKRHPQDEALQAFYSVEAACEHLWGLLQPGDLVLLKGTGNDHLGHIIVARPPGEGRHAQHGSNVLSSEESRAPHFGESHAHRRLDVSWRVPMTGSECPAQAIVGLGNPGEQFRGTPHNVGQRVIELLAHSLGGEWIREEQAMVARVRWQGADIYLIKPLTDINATGPLLLQLRQRLGFGPAECVLIHDDLDLPLGTVRVRMQGSDGGHRGIRSILEAFRTDALCRVKIGVGRPAQQGQRTDSVMTAFASAELPVIDRACAEAADRCLALVGDRRHRTS